MTEYLRVLQEAGLERFQDYINRLKDGINETLPINDLRKEPFSIEFDPKIKAEIPSFATRLEMGKYLCTLLQGIKRNKLIAEKGLWSWLALLWFDVICPRDKNGERMVRESAKYICSSDYTDYYRHFVAASWDIYSLHGRFSRLMLYGPTYEHSDWIEQIASHQNIITNRNFIEAIDKLYWDNNTGKHKKGALSYKKPGNIRRLINTMEQFKLTYDTFLMPSGEILSLLPKEFNKWKE
jgi:hypothetical protein